MSYPLAVLVPEVGAASETFIRRHVQDLLPGKTVVVATSVRRHGVHWKAEGPVLDLSAIGRSLGRRLVRGASRGLGLPVPDFSARAVKRFLKQHRVQVVMGEYLDQSLPWLDLARKLGLRFFGHAHGFDVSSLLREAKWRAEYLRYNQSNGIIGMSHATRARLVGLGIVEAKMHVIPYGVDVPVHPKHRAAKETVRCLAVGRMVAKKAPILMLDAFRRAAEKCPNLRLDYVGTGPLQSAASQFVRAFGLGDRVTLHGGQPNQVVQGLMDEADMFVQHSMTDPETGDEEGLPVAILEAMAHGLPVVSTCHAGIPEAVSDGVSGYLVEEGDSVTMAERIEFLARNCDLSRQMGVAGWQRASDHFTWKKERTELLKVLGLNGVLDT